MPFTKRERIRLNTDGMAYRRFSRMEDVSSAAPASEPAADLDGEQRTRPEVQEQVMQQVILRGHDGGESDTAVAWDIRASAHVAALILRHLAADPPPEGSATASDWRKWAENLQRDAQARQEALGRAVRLRAV